MSTRQIMGWIGPSGDRHVSGWILDKKDDSKILEVIIEINGTQVASVIAKQPRPQLKERGFKTMSHGFKVYVPYDVLVDSPGTIRMWHVDTPSTVIEASKQLPQFVPSDQDPLLTMIGDGLEEQKKGMGLDWNKIASIGTSLLSNEKFESFLLSAGRGCIRSRRYDDGQHILRACVFLFPKNQEALFYKGVLHSNSGEYQEALDIFQQLRNEQWNPMSTMLEYCKALARFIDKNGHRTDSSLEDLFLKVVRELVTLDDGTIIYPTNVPLLLSSCGDVNMALIVANRLINMLPNQPHGMVNKARILMDQGYYDEGLQLCRDILQIWPDNEVANYHLRVYSHFSGTNKLQRTTTFAVLETTDNINVVRVIAEGVPMEETESFRKAIDLARDIDWFLVPGKPIEYISIERLELAKSAARAGCINLPDGIGRLWRGEVLRNLIESNLLDPNIDLLKQLERWHPIYIEQKTSSPRHGGQVLLISRYGTAKFGGAEHTMASLSKYYRESGRSTVLAGTDKQVDANVDLGEGQRGDRVPNDPAGLRAYILTAGFDVVHAISGMGFQVAQALAYSNITMVYGIYFWRDVLGRDGLETYFSNDGSPIPRLEFKYILLQAQTVFVNSKYTRSVIEKAHNIRLPIIYSIPEEIMK